MTVHSDYIIMGGGVAGLTLALILAAEGRSVRVIEKSSYPSHKVCGEYLSNEVLPLMNKYGILENMHQIPEISRFRLSDISGGSIDMGLDLGGIGISRFELDHLLFRKAESLGAVIHQNEKVSAVTFDEAKFSVQTDRNKYSCNWLIGAFGKRSVIDRILNRSFMQKRSPYVGIKYHVECDSFPRDLVALHNFDGGYCGVNAVENGRVNICYLAHRSRLRKAGNISDLEKDILFKNPLIRKTFSESKMIWDKPLVINEISFETKSPLEQHILMCGDAAGMITPLCGNGMAMAMHSAYILSEILLQYAPGDISARSEIEARYRKAWKNEFSIRLTSGRLIQRLFGKGQASKMTVSLGRNFPGAGTWLMKQTHGLPFGQ